MMPINVHTNKYCAACKHWNDPANTCIRPIAPKFGQWEIDGNVKKLCLLTNFKETRGKDFCSKFECKF